VKLTSASTPVQHRAANRGGGSSLGILAAVALDEGHAAIRHWGVLPL
jgi:hypothetical protein